MRQHGSMLSKISGESPDNCLIPCCSFARVSRKARAFSLRGSTPQTTAPPSSRASNRDTCCRGPFPGPYHLTRVNRPFGLYLPPASAEGHFFEAETGAFRPTNSNGYRLLLPPKMVPLLVFGSAPFTSSNPVSSGTRSCCPSYGCQDGGILSSVIQDILFNASPNSGIVFPV